MYSIKKTNILLLLIISSIALISTQSCKKYPENNGISLRSKSERVANTWQVENYKINGTDFTSLVSNYNETFTKNGAYSYSWGNKDGSGAWTFQNDYKEIKLNGNDDQANRTIYILKLEEKAFWYYYMDGNDRHDLHLISK